MPLPTGGAGIEEAIMQLMMGEGGAQAPPMPPAGGTGMPLPPPGAGPGGPPMPPMPEEEQPEPILESPDGSEWRLTIDNDGNIGADKVFDPEEDDTEEELEV